MSKKNPEFENRGGWNRSATIQKAFLAYMAISSPRRGDMKRIAQIHNIPPSSLATQLSRRAARKEIKYPAQYKKSNA